MKREPTTPRCPACHGPLHAAGDEAAARRCAGCGGVLLVAGLPEIRALHDAVPALEAGEMDLDGELSCPYDAGTMSAESFAELGGLRIRRCGECHAIWLAREDAVRFSELDSDASSPLVRAASRALQSDVATTAEGHPRIVWRRPVRLDAYVLGVALVPIFPGVIVLLASGAGGGTARDALLPVCGTFAILGVVFLIAWIVSRTVGERSILLTDRAVYLPPVHQRLFGRWIPLRDIVAVECCGAANRYVRIDFAGGTRTYNQDVVEVKAVQIRLRQAVDGARGAGAHSKRQERGWEHS